jgi:hypothetical protein
MTTGSKGSLFEIEQLDVTRGLLEDYNCEREVIGWKQKLYESRNMRK